VPKKTSKAESRIQKPETGRKKAKPFYKSPPPKPDGRAALPRRQADRQVSPANDIPHAHLIATAPFTLREDGSIENIKGSATVPVAPSGVPPNGTSEDVSGGTPATAGVTPALPRLIYQSDTPFVRLYHGNSLELLDAIAAKYPAGRFDAIFADPPYFLSNGGITCHAGKMVKVDKGDWDVSRGPELNHEFNVEWLRRCQRVLKPNGTIWVTGTHHVIFSIGYAMQQLGYKILNDIAWEKPNPPPNLSCRYFTHSTETVLWAAKSEKSKHVFNYQEMRKVTGKQMKTVWRREEFMGSATVPVAPFGVPPNEMSEDVSGATPNTAGATPALPGTVWTMTAPSGEEKRFGKHPTQKPVALVERCLLASTNEGDLVLDPFLGGGTTVVASLRLNRGCVGIEMDIVHLNLAQRRADREIIEIWLRHFRVRIEVCVLGRAELPLRQAVRQHGPTESAS
jgi:site-specific DNA-methyltransferase (adenine-specific)